YSVQDSQGSRGTISFAEGHVVGAFFDKASPRHPRRTSSFDSRVLLAGMPANLLTIAEAEVLPYLLQDLGAGPVPVFTAAFWDRDETLAAAETWETVLDNGARLISTQLLSFEEGLAEWSRIYDMSGTQVALAASLFDRKVARPNDLLRLNPTEVRT